MHFAQNVFLEVHIALAHVPFEFFSLGGDAFRILGVFFFADVGGMRLGVEPLAGDWVEAKGTVVEVLLQVAVQVVHDVMHLIVGLVV